jgi:hypothetical protein
MVAIDTPKTYDRVTPMQESAATRQPPGPSSQGAR